MDVFEAILSRRTIRKFEDREVPATEVEKILEACRWSPSWANTQCWEIVVLRDARARKAIEVAVPEGNPAYRCVCGAPLVLAVCAKLGASGYYHDAVTTKFGDWFLFDLGIATQNISLAAHALGLGSVVLGLFDQDKARTAIGVPEGYELVTLMPMGYPAEEPRVPKRKLSSDFSHYDQW